MNDMLYLNGVNLHHGAVAEEREMNMQCRFTPGQDHLLYIRHNLRLTAKCETLQRKTTPSDHCQLQGFFIYVTV